MRSMSFNMITHKHSQKCEDNDEKLSYGRDIGKGTQVLSMLAWRTASLLCRRLLIVVLNLRCEREWREG